MITICCCGGIQVIVHDRNEVKPSEIGCFPDLKALWSTFPRSIRLHMERVGKYADVMCRYMAENNIEDMNNRVGQDFLSVSREIFALHDIGRHYIPFALLNKVGELTPEETEFIRNHTVFARRAIRWLRIFVRSHRLSGAGSWKADGADRKDRQGEGRILYGKRS